MGFKRIILTNAVPGFSLATLPVPAAALKPFHTTNTMFGEQPRILRLRTAGFLLL
jgi:hypothetical protein